MTTSAAPPTTSRRQGIVPVLLAIGAAAVAGIIGCFIIATIAKAAGAPRDFQAFRLASYALLVIVGVTIGAVGWNVVRHRSADPQRLLARLVPIVLVLTLIPDVLVGVTKGLPYTTWGGVIALMLMHVLVAAAAVVSYRRFLPVTNRPSHA